MIRCGDGDGVDLFILEQFANIDAGFWLWQSHLLDLFHTLLRNVFIDVAQNGQFRSWDARKAVDVVVAAASHSANRHADTIVCAKDSSVAGCACAESRGGHAGARYF